MNNVILWLIDTLAALADTSEFAMVICAAVLMGCAGLFNRFFS